MKGQKGQPGGLQGVNCLLSCGHAMAEESTSVLGIHFLHVQLRRVYRSEVPVLD